MKLDTIIVLGAGMTPSLQLPNEAKERLNKAIEIFIKHHSKQIIVSGKHSYKFKKSPNTTEAELMKYYLISKGIPHHQIIKEEYSQDTFGNAYFTRQYIIDPKQIKEFAVVTSDYHIPKSAFLFRKVYGPEYQIHFVAAKSSHTKGKLQKLKVREEMVKSILNKYLSKINVGDIKALRKFLYNKHPIYKGKSGILFELFKKGIKMLEPEKK
ncbi:YdcF family protein [archaeon]|jgi:uncharacterized SAM-binding protein YcdF (DUF218 family)|nr:YdcF family protein [archaeon]MBT6762809.1 YdcF family protein [archaeon]